MFKGAYSLHALSVAQWERTPNYRLLRRDCGNSQTFTQHSRNYLAACTLECAWLTPNSTTLILSWICRATCCRVFWHVVPFDILVVVGLQADLQHNARQITNRTVCNFTWLHKNKITISCRFVLSLLYIAWSNHWVQSVQNEKSKYLEVQTVR